MKNEVKRLSTIMTAAVLMSSSFAPLVGAAEQENGEDPYEQDAFPALLGNEKVRKPSQAGALQLIDHEGQRVLADEWGIPSSCAV
ncbi:MAG: hypothetical protein U5K84_06660 [Alkalibacterium sp.]|nr:hypothetical protein [Alkalibacterium sp.]